VFSRLRDRFERWLFERREGPIARYREILLTVLRYGYAIVRDVSHGELTLYAMSLVYTTLLSLVPLLALSFSVLKGLGYHRDLEPVLYEFLSPLGDRAAELTAQIMQFVENVQGGVLGSIGLGFLLYTVISMVQKVESSFNFVWRVEQPRSFGRRLSEYLSVMVVGPVMIVFAAGLLASLASHELVQRVSHVEPFGSLLVGAGRLTPWMLVTGAFAFLYHFVPNTRVKISAALGGGAVAAFLWVAIGGLFASFVAVSTQTQAIYAGFAIVIVALVWIYVNWLVLLIGAQLAFYLQHPQLLRHGRQDFHLDSTSREELALALMSAVATNFVQPVRPLNLADVAERVEVPARALASVARAHEARGLLLITEESGLVPGRAIDNIKLAEILDAARRHTGNVAMQPQISGPAVRVAGEVDAAIRASVEGRTLRDLVE
jgi:membrane protein